MPFLGSLLAVLVVILVGPFGVLLAVVVGVVIIVVAGFAHDNKRRRPGRPDQQGARSRSAWRSESGVDPTPANPMIDNAGVVTPAST